MFQRFLDQFYNEPVPNNFTIQMGELIRAAREEKGWSQAQLAESIYRRRPSLSDMENGKMIVDSITLYMLSICLDKPLSYFIPPKYRRNLFREELTTEEQALILQYRRIQSEDKQQLALAQIKALADFDNREE